MDVFLKALDEVVDQQLNKDNLNDQRTQRKCEIPRKSEDEQLSRKFWELEQRFSKMELMLMNENFANMTN